MPESHCRLLHLLLAVAMLSLSSVAPAATTIIGSKAFTESVILGELATQLTEEAGFDAEHRRQLGGTRVLWSALIRGDIQCYPEYTGTLRTEIFSSENIGDDVELRRALAREKIWTSTSLGFNNTYVLGMRRDRAAELGITRMSQLADHPTLRFGFSNEFMERADGWPGIRTHYRLPQRDVRGLSHDLAYRGLESRSLDLTDLYSTDAEIVHYDLTTLVDDARFFPVYDAIILCRDDVPEAIRESLNRLGGRIDEMTMTKLNARAALDREPEAQIAASFLRDRMHVSAEAKVQSRSARIWQRTREHLAMVGISLGLAVLVAVPLGIVAFYRRGVGRVVFTIADILQTLPALALLVFLIPWLGIGYAPAIVALFLYSVLPILRNTHTGLADIPRDLRESAEALGLPRIARLRYVELPLAARSMLAGVRTAAVINVGTATLGALIGAGGYGQPILTGIRLDDTNLILEGAVPAALLALLVQWVFGWIERRWVAAK
ncbi:amino acid ABC transporter permease [Steroidobacter agaridevorans]|uniref:Amino acid ABC transporter permease n=1 Tax=Steroidobacter agaridevorans TaxID=2695856 RepID=A0A829Y7X4_9GAMM|nr:glycine betaine ABC transporter substrate-binding protein [Steroidobacter agaridevorans]GFE79065.1 amino acid ABC transporter permease [Steroidobacter agaridevorans]GFE88221.1 amino acid ABC transporter permease [Steroidobacter agaridevorans]